MGDPRVAKRLFVDFGREPFLAQVQGHRDLCPQGCESFQVEYVSLSIRYLIPNQSAEVQVTGIVLCGDGTLVL